MINHGEAIILLVELDWRLAYHPLRANGYSLPWIEERRAIEAERDEALEALEIVWEYRHSKHERFSGKENSHKTKSRAFTSAVKRIN